MTGQAACTLQLCFQECFSRCRRQLTNRPLLMFFCVQSRDPAVHRHHMALDKKPHGGRRGGDVGPAKLGHIYATGTSGFGPKGGCAIPWLCRSCRRTDHKVHRIGHRTTRLTEWRMDHGSCQLPSTSSLTAAKACSFLLEITPRHTHVTPSAYLPVCAQACRGVSHQL